MKANESFFSLRLTCRAYACATVSVSIGYTGSTIFCRCQAFHEVCTGKTSIVSLLHVLMFKLQSRFDVLLPLDFFGFYFRFQFYSFSFGHSTTLASKIEKAHILCASALALNDDIPSFSSRCKKRRPYSREGGRTNFLVSCIKHY